MHSVINWSNDIFIIHSKWTDISWTQEVLGEASRIAYKIPSQASSNFFFYFPYCIVFEGEFLIFNGQKKEKIGFLYIVKVS